MTDSFWERQETVDQFAGRAADHRLEPLVGRYANPSTSRVLDLGCAGGRNTFFLAERGFDVWAIDSSHAMIEHTRERLARILSPEQVRERVILGPMDDLSRFPNGYFVLIVALGIFHNATSWSEWERSIAEAVRVLAPGGRILLNQFTPQVKLDQGTLTRVPGEAHLYDGLSHGRAVLLDAEELDHQMAKLDLIPEVPSETVRVRTDSGQRVSVNSLYRKHGGDRHEG